MIETTVLNYLSQKTTAPIRFERSPDMPEKCIVIEKTGSSYNEELYTATMAIQSYGKTLAEAAALNTDVIRWMLAMRDTEQNIFDVSLNSDYNFTDSATKRYRYQAVFVITYNQ